MIYTGLHIIFKRPTNKKKNSFIPTYLCVIWIIVREHRDVKIGFPEFKNIVNITIFRPGIKILIDNKVLKYFVVSAILYAIFIINNVGMYCYLRQPLNYC